MVILNLLGSLCLVAGGITLVVAALGLDVLPNTLSKQHAATKAGTLSVTLVCLGAILLTLELGWAIRLLLIIIFLIATLPLASHMLARSAIKDLSIIKQTSHPKVTQIKK